MGILSQIFSKIFPASHPAAAGPASPSDATVSNAPSAQSSSPSVAQQSMPNSPSAISEVDVETILNQRAQQNSEKLNWKTSIVDLMKLLGLDSSLTARKQLAQELKYSGDTNDSASMNIWLHKQVMGKVAANGGKVPADLV